MFVLQTTIGCEYATIYATRKIGISRGLKKPIITGLGAT